MKTWICTTLTNFWGPMQGPARVYAYLKTKGYDVALKDFNQDAYFTLLSKAYLDAFADRTINFVDPAIRSTSFREEIGSTLLHSSNMTMRRVLARSFLAGSRAPALMKEYRFLREPALKYIGSRIKPENIFYALLSEKAFMITEVEKARKALDERFLSLDAGEFLRNFNTLLCGKALIDMIHFPAQIDFGFGFYGAAYSPRVKDIMTAVKDERLNFLIPYYRNKVLPLLECEQPGVVGISITHTAEFIPVFTLAAMIKAKHPQVHVCLGGAVATEVAYRIQKNKELWQFIDSIVLGPGESAFGELIDAVGKGTPLSDVPNLIYKENTEIRKSEETRSFAINDAVTPDFGTLRPRSVVPLEASTGCYWGKCIFCYYPKMGTSDFSTEHRDKRMRHIDLVVKDMDTLRDRYDPLYIGFTDSAVSPARLERIAEHTLASDKKTYFSAFMRFEKEFLSKPLCEKLARGGLLGGQIGLESGSQRVNDIINKGIAVKDAEVIIRNFHAAGIAIHLYTLVGMPGEVEKECYMTYKFIKKWKRYLCLDWTIYSLYVLAQSPLIERSAALGLKTKPLPDDFLSQLMEYEIDNGISQEGSIAFSTRFYEQLKPYLHPLRHIMDTESYKAFILGQKARGMEPRQLRRLARRLTK